MAEALATAAVYVDGLRELQFAFSKAGKEANLLMKTGLRQVAEPIRADAQRLAVEKFPKSGPPKRRSGIGVKWSIMRVGVTRNLVYVAPKQRGRRYPADPMKRPAFGALLAERAMQPALDRNQGRIASDMERLFDRLAADFNRAA